MYKPHILFDQPEDLNTKVWRYMDFTKFVAMLIDESLYFCRTDLLGDPHEGSYPIKNMRHRYGFYDLVFKDSPIEERQQHSLSVSELLKSETQVTAANCWHMNSVESAAMWRLYLKSNEGIAIQSTYQKLRDSFDQTEKPISVGLVRYLNYETDGFEEIGSSHITPFIYKRRSFEHEHEVRALLQNRPSTGVRCDPMPAGENIKVDLHKLIEQIYIAPSLPEWFESVVKSTVRRYGLDVNVTRSNLDQKPLY